VTIELEVRGAFSLEQSIAFAEGFDAAAIGGGDGVFRAALVEDDGTAAAIAVRQTGDRLAVEHGSVLSDERIAMHAARILSVDIDGSGLEDVAARDSVVGTMVDRFPGRRPVCFGTPYEAAAWSALSQRASMRQAAALKRRLTAELGERVKVADHELTAFPAPATVVGATELPGVTGRRADRLGAVAQAAPDGVFDPSALRAVDVEQALERLREVHGVGPFSAALILGRGAGHPDLAPPSIAPARRAIAQAYGLGEVDDERAAEIADGWRPFARGCSSCCETQRLGDDSLR